MNCHAVKLRTFTKDHFTVIQIVSLNTRFLDNPVGPIIEKIRLKTVLQTEAMASFDLDHKTQVETVQAGKLRVLYRGPQHSF